MWSELWMRTCLCQPYFSERIKISAWGYFTCLLTRFQIFLYRRVLCIHFHDCFFIHWSRFFVLQTRDGVWDHGIIFLLVQPFVNTLVFWRRQIRLILQQITTMFLTLIACKQWKGSMGGRQEFRYFCYVIYISSRTSRRVCFQNYYIPWTCLDV